MLNMNEYLLYIIIGICSFNLYINIKLLLSNLFDKTQKIMQSLIIWLLPLVGGLVVLYFINDDDQGPPRNRKKGNYANDSMPGGVQ